MSNKKNLLGLAISIAAKAFEGVVDKSGEPYIMHCFEVMRNTVGSLEVKIAAMLHDLVEDTDWTIEMLREQGFSERTLELIKLLTHNKEDPYMDYIKPISYDKDASEIKRRDLEHNSRITRLQGLTKKDLERMEKYHLAFTYLKHC
jgi:(p)ppGpp synthase/HD superfamily hydrolase